MLCARGRQCEVEDQLQTGGAMWCGGWLGNKTVGRECGGHAVVGTLELVGGDLGWKLRTYDVGTYSTSL
jgi:hypothetical protein